jgi:hypothetical protein
VQRNIAAFGGDPHKVIIAGESAGGGSVHAMMTSPLTTGLFNRSIVQSGGGRSLLKTTGLHEGRDGMPSAEQIGVAFAATKGINGDGPEALKLPNWPAYQSGTDILIDFTDSGPMAIADPWKERLDLTQELASKQANK